MARRELCTYFNVQYLDKGLAMFESVARHLDDFHMRAVCFDDLTYVVVREIGDPRLEPVHIATLEAADEALVETRIQRSQVEYMWTATPCVIRYFRDRDGLDEITYIDADTFFFGSPEPFFEGLGDGSVLLTPASSSPQHYSRGLVRRTGLFVVQFMTFRSDATGRAALEWWRERCIEWCFARYEDGKMGDQLYLNDWQTRFGGVRLLGHAGLLGPWCIESRDVATTPSSTPRPHDPSFSSCRRWRWRRRWPCRSTARPRAAAGPSRSTRTTSPCARCRQPNCPGWPSWSRAGCRTSPPRTRRWPRSRWPGTTACGSAPGSGSRCMRPRSRRRRLPRWRAPLRRRPGARSSR